DLARPGGLARQGGRRQRAHGRFAATAVGPAARAPRQADAEDRRPPPGGRALTAPDVTLISPYPVGGERHGGLSGVAGYTARLAGALADRGAEVPLIAPTEDGAPARVARAGLARVQSAIRNNAGAVVVHEPGLAQAIPEATVIPHGVDVLNHSPRAARERLGFEDERRLLVLCFGFLAPYKGLEAA